MFNRSLTATELSPPYLSELRQELGLEQVLAGSKVERVTYRDRYLKGKEAKILLDLLREELAPSAEVKIWVLENA